MLFLAKYLYEYLDSEESGYNAYVNISFEKEGHDKENDINDFFQKNTKEFNSIYNSTSLNDSQKANKLQALGIRGVAIPSLNRVKQMLYNTMSRLNNDKSYTNRQRSSLSRELNSLLDKVNEDIKNKEHEANHFDNQH